MLTNTNLLSKRQQIEKMISLPTIVLNSEEADKFIDYMIEQAVLKDTARIIKMTKESKEIRALGFGEGRFLHPGATFSSSDYKKTFAHNKITLTTKKVRGCVVIYDDDLEDNIEGDAFIGHIMKIVAGKIQNELEEAFWIGDTHSLAGFGADDIRSLWDGWRYQFRNSQVAGDPYYNNVSGGCPLVSGRGTAATIGETAWVLNTATAVGAIVRPTVYNGYCYIATAVAGDTQTGATEPTTWPVVLGQTIVDDMVTWRCHAHLPVLGGQIVVQNAAVPYNWQFTYSNMLKAMDSKYKKGGLGNLRFIHSDQVTQNYIDGLAARSTILGDNAILGKAPLQYGTVPIVSMPLMPLTMTQAGVFGGTGGAYTDSLLLPKGNIIIGIQRSIKIESQREAADEATYWFYSMRADLAIENVNAAVLCERLVTG